MSDSLFTENRVALITGAAMGIGRAAAIEFVKRGMSVIAIDVDADELSTLPAEVSGSADQLWCLPIDLAEQNAIATLQQTVADRYPHINVLMNNAVTREGRTFDGSIEQWKHLFDVNVWALADASRRFLPPMLSSNERCAIINVGSKQGITNPPGTPAYNMAKAAVKLFTEQLEHDIRNRPDNQHGRVSSHLLVSGWTTTGKNEHKPGAWLPAQVVDTMINTIDAGGFYIICPDGEVTTDMDNRRIVWGAEDITNNRPPLSRWHSAHREAADKACS